MGLLDKIIRFFRKEKQLPAVSPVLGNERTFDEIYEDPGVFQYYAEGFSVRLADRESNPIAWQEVVEINAYKADLSKADRVCLDIVLRDQKITISEELPGWFQFVVRMKRQYPEVSPNWDLDIMQPPFQRNYTTIYKLQQ